MICLVTGACGFIGTNIVDHLAGFHEITGIDNLSRKGSGDNLAYLSKYYPKVDFHCLDIRYPIPDNFPDVGAIYHMAAQVGVQSSINDPRNDFEVNALGTFNLLEYARRMDKPPIFVFASTNKVYGNLQTSDPVSEQQPLDFHTPYGVSKGAAEQYVLDYSRMFGIKGLVFRQSCIYGDFQLGAEEQGWVAWFLIANRKKQPLTIYGDGTQRRDVLYIKDLMELYDKCLETDNYGKAYNVGGGKGNTLSLLELVDKAKITTKISYSDWRPADQKCYISDIEKVKNDFDWQPKVGVEEGLERLNKYVGGGWRK